MKVRYFSHATFQLIGEKGGRLLTDPWLFNPVYGHMIWQFPECPIPVEEFVDQDVIYISHEHPDHFCPRTLDLFPRKTTILIRKYGARLAMKKRLYRMGFENIIELSHRESMRLEVGLTVTLVADPSSSDSLLIVSDDLHTVLDQNDCIPTIEDQNWIGQNFDIDLGLLFYSGGSQYPACFVMSDEAKQAAVKRRIKSQMIDAIETAARMGIKNVVPAANDMCTYRNAEFDQYASALPVEFRNFVLKSGSDLTVFLMSPGETYSFEETPDVYTRYFPNRAAWKAQANQLRERPDVVRTKDKLEAFEREAKLDREAFQTLITQYFHRLESKEFAEHERIEVGFVISEGEQRYGYLISREIEGWRISHGDLGSILKSVGIHMCITVKAEAVALAMSGALTWEDLLNGQYRIYRPIHSFDDNEYTFWEVLSGFTSFLEEVEEQPAIGLRGSFQIISASQSVTS